MRSKWMKTALAAGAAIFLAGCQKEEIVQKEEEAPVEEETEQQAEARILARIEGEPVGVVVKSGGTLLVTDTFNKVVWEVTEEGAVVYAGQPGPEDAFGEPLGDYSDNSLELARFQAPWGIAPYLNGWAVADGGNSCVRWMDEEFVRTAAYKNSERVMTNPTGLAVDNEGSLYIADAGANVVYKMDTEGILTVAAEGFSSPAGLCWKKDTLYIADMGNHRICALKDGEVSVVAGAEEGYADGKVTEALFRNPQGVVVDDDGTVYVADTGNNAVRKIAGDEVTTLLAADGDLIWPVSPCGIAMYQDGLVVTDAFTGVVFTMNKD